MRTITETMLAAALLAASCAGPARPTQTPMQTAVAKPAVVAPAATPAADDTAALPDLDHDRVDYWIRRFTTDQRKSFAIYLGRMTAFAPLIESKLDQRDMPRELVYLAMMESGFNPKAQSPAKAKGLWQFMAATAEEYGLKVNRKIDERVDPAKSTDAALTYLTDLYDRFGSWYLAAAAYNSGENRVARVMREVTGSERGSEEDFFTIARRLPAETRDYVPRLIAAARIAREPQKYGFTEGQS
jgi:membrane-bound lytic murein transglycosylase D